MKVQIIRSTVADGSVVKAGQVVSLTVESAREIMRLGKAIPYDEKEPLVDRSVGLTTESQPKLVKRKATKKTLQND
jgi:hypothetical protein